MKTFSIFLTLSTTMALLASAPAETILASAVYGGHTYHLLSQSNWTDAEATAVSLGGHLATINDASENAFVFDTFANYGSLSRNIWIGLNDAATEGTFVWSSGETPNFYAWSPGEPNNASFAGYPSGEDYVHFFAPNIGLPDYTWNDAPDLSDWEPLKPGRKQLFGVVEVNAVPEPASLAPLGVGAFALLRRRRLGKSPYRPR